MATVSFLGLGVMGYPMAGHLAAKGHTVRVYNRTAAKAEKWAGEHGGSFGTTPKAAAEGSEIVFCCVGNDDDLRSVVLGDDGAFAGMSAGTIFVDHTTASANVARELNAAGKELGIEFIDAPVSGGQAGAENGRLTIMAGGGEEDCARAQAVAACYFHKWLRMGGPGTGQLTKMVNQICIAGLVQGLAEGVHFAEQAGLDTAKV
ncbi:MAG: NAD(P)-dependent oxidoreductase, partial [Pseudomonadota bacterium]